MNTQNPKEAKRRRLTKNLVKVVNRAIDSYSLIRNGDRVCVALSGGKDSLALLYLLKEHQRKYPWDYTIGAVHVVSDFGGEYAQQARQNAFEHCRLLEIPLEIRNITVTEAKDGSYAEPSCFWCSWKRREALFTHCADEGYNRLAFGHHADDVAETSLLNLFYHGTLETMYPIRTFFDGVFDVIRPLFFVRERETADFASANDFLHAACTCMHAASGKRARMKKFITDIRKDAHQLHANIWNASEAWWRHIGDTHLRESGNNQISECNDNANGEKNKKEP
jgi:tRNA 2-thiocytidine biosynthesis protein TtcA